MKGSVIIFLILLQLSVMIFGKGAKLKESLYNILTEHIGKMIPKFQEIKDTDEFNTEFDFIVIGAGSGGSAVTNRLTEINNWSVLLLEAGDDENAFTEIPIAVSYLYNSKYNWGYKTEYEINACLSMKGNKCALPRGKAMGGSSAINYMVYGRGFQQDYDAWAELGNEGWSYKDVLPYFQKLENGDSPNFSDQCVAKGGPLSVEELNWKSRMGESFLEACHSNDYNVNENGCVEKLGCSYILTNTKKGARYSASKAYLRPIQDRKNLRVSKNSLVTKILIQDKKAVGVEFIKKEKSHTAKAKKEVILCAGALNSPQILMLSGIGPAELLDDLEIPVIRDLKVGYNLHDQVGLQLLFKVDHKVTVNESRIASFKNLMEYLTQGKGPFTTPGALEGVLYTKSSLAKEEAGPDLKILFIPGAITGDSGGSVRNLLNLDDEFYEKIVKPYKKMDVYTLVPEVKKPFSRGRVVLRTNKATDAPLIYSNYFGDQRDLQMLLDGVRKALVLSESPSLVKLGSQLITIPIPGCENEKFNSDEYWFCAARHFTFVTHNLAGTCKMGPVNDPEAVVDPHLRVHGIHGLRVMDASVIPVSPTAPLNGVVIMIAEKGADLIKSSYQGDQSESPSP